MKTTITITTATRKQLNKIKYDLDCKNLDNVIQRLIIIAKEIKDGTTKNNS